MTVSITRDGTKVWLVLATGLPSGQEMRFEWNADREIYAEALTNQLARHFGDVIARDRGAHYDEGYRDGQRDARSHRPPRRRVFFERRL